MKIMLHSILMMIVLAGLSGCASTSPLEDDLFQESQTTLPTAPMADSPDVDAETQHTLRLFPLYVGSTWIYDYLGYNQNTEVVWQIVEWVVDTRIINGYYVAVMDRHIKQIDGATPQNFLSAPKPGRFWYLVDGRDVYRFESLINTNLSGAWLDLVLPFPENGAAWYPNPDQRAHFQMSITGFRYASAPFQRVLPLGGTYTCYNVATRYQDGTAESTFCENVGFVYHEFNLFNRAFGYRSELRDFYFE